MNILILLIILICLLLSLKLKISLYFRLDNLNIYFDINTHFIKIKRKGNLVKKKRKHVIQNSSKKDSKIKDFTQNISFTELNSFLKYIEIEKLNIDIIIGLILLFPTIFAIPILSTFIDIIKFIPFKKLNNFNYSIMPKYEELQLNLEVQSVIKIRIFDIMKICFKLVKIYFKGKKNENELLVNGFNK